MITIIQRVTQAQVCIAGEQVGKIKHGIMALVAIEKQDSEKSAQRLFERILNYRIFPDTENRMNLNLQTIQGGLLLVPQFTLAADTNSGNRPSFTPAAFLARKPSFVSRLWEPLPVSVPSFSRLASNQ